MFTAKLLVDRGSIHDKSQDWGNYGFVSLPSPGDRIATHYNDSIHYMTVICVHHRPVQLHADGALESATPPTAEVVAKWTSSDDDTPA